MGNDKAIWDYLRGKGLSACGAAGLMGNLYAESGLNPCNLQNTYNKSLGLTDEAYTAAVDDGSYTNFVRDSAGYGLAQWTFWSRKQMLLNYAKEAGTSIGDLNMQLDFLVKELTTNYAGIWKTLKCAESVQEASNAVLLKFERPKDQSEAVQKKRAEYGQAYYDKYAKGGNSMKILLIAGHGAGDPGAVGKHNGITYQEATLARNVVAALEKKLEQYMTVDIYPTQRCAYDDYRAGTLKSRASFKNYNYVLEIHFNAFKATGADEKTKGIEAYVTTSEAGVGVEEAICRNVAALGLTNRGVKRKNWSVIATAKGQGVSSCLLEVCFIDDPDDMAIYTSKFDAVMDAIAKGIVEGFNQGTYSTGKKVVTGWQLINGAYYFYNASGVAVTNQIVDGAGSYAGHKFYCGTDGKVVTKTELTVGGKTYIADDVGRLTEQKETGLFSDVAKDAWYAEAVEFCVENGLMQGTDNGKFEPEGTVTRAQMAKILMRLCKKIVV